MLQTRPATRSAVAIPSRRLLRFLLCLGGQAGTFDQPYSTLAAGIAATVDNAIVIMKPGATTERPAPNRIMRFKAWQGTATIGQ